MKNAGDQMRDLLRAALNLCRLLIQSGSTRHRARGADLEFLVEPASSVPTLWLNPPRSVKVHQPLLAVNGTNGNPPSAKPVAAITESRVLSLA